MVSNELYFKMGITQGRESPNMMEGEVRSLTCTKGEMKGPTSLVQMTKSTH